MKNYVIKFSLSTIFLIRQLSLSLSLLCWTISVWHITCLKKHTWKENSFTRRKRITESSRSDSRRKKGNLMKEMPLFRCVSRFSVYLYLAWAEVSRSEKNACCFSETTDGAAPAKWEGKLWKNVRFSFGAIFDATPAFRSTLNRHRLLACNSFCW